MNEPRDYVGVARVYEAAVRVGKIPACKWVRLACERNHRDTQRAKAKTAAFPFSFDTAAASKICETAELLPHIKGPKAQQVRVDGELRWQTIELEPWQCWILTTLFGWKRREDHLRRFRIGLVLVPRKNTKSTMAAIVVLYMLAPEDENGAECYSAATTRDQAKVVAEIAWEMAKRSPQFCDQFGVRIGAATTRHLSVPARASNFGPLSADANSLDGLNVSCAVVDELHAHKTRAVWDVLDTATGARLQPLLLPISTAGVDIGGICYEQMSYLQKVLEQTLEDETYFGINYTVDDGDAWDVEATWRKANPNYGVSVMPDDLARKANKAKHSPAAINNFLTKHLNVWVRAESTWMPMDAWRACGAPTLTIEQFLKAPCWIGIDLAETRDIAAVVALFRPSPGRYVVFGRYYLPKDTIDRSPVAQYSGWVRQGYLIETDGNVADYGRIERDIGDWCERLNVRMVCFDRALAAQMGQQLEARFKGKPPMITVNQNVETMNPAMTTAERLVLSGAVAHNADPVLTWMFSNVVVERNYKDEVYPRKAGGKDSANKIDGAVAMFTALSQAMLEPDEPIRKTRGQAKLWTPGGFRPALPEPVGAHPGSV